MPASNVNLSPLLNHVFLDFENVQQIDLAVIGSKAVNFTLLVGPRQTKLDVALVEKLVEHANSVQLVRLTSAGRNALDFAVAYYLGRAVSADPTGCFHIVSKDTGFNPLIEHLRSRHIQVHRHDSFATLPFLKPTAQPASSTPAAAPKLKPPSKVSPTTPAVIERVARIVEHLRKPSSNRPRTKTKLISFVVAHLGHKITDAEALEVVDHLRNVGSLTIAEKGAVSYHLESK